MITLPAAKVVGKIGKYGGSRSGPAGRPGAYLRKYDHPPCCYIQAVVTLNKLYPESVLSDIVGILEL